MARELQWGPKTGDGQGDGLSLLVTALRVERATDEPVSWRGAGEPRLAPADDGGCIVHRVDRPIEPRKQKDF